MNLKLTNDQLALSTSLTAKTNALCLGLESGAADLLELVTPTTAELLGWWFGEDMVAARGGLNFHTGQRQAILNAIVAHEVLGAGQAHWGLLDLYKAAAPDALLAGNRMAEVSAAKHSHPKYCFKMATGTGKTWVLQALMIWQLLNKTAALEAGIDDARFTRHFMVVAPGLIVYERLLDAFCGKLVENGHGARDFSRSDVAQFADLFIPEAYRERVFAFVRGNVCSKGEIGLKATGNGMIAITNWHLLAEGEVLDDTDEEVSAPGAPLPPEQVVHAVLPLTPGRATGNALDVLDRRWARGNVLAYLTELPELMVFNDEAHHIHEFKREGETTEVEWQKSLSRIAETKGRRFVQVDFSATPYNDVGTGKNKKKLYFPHIVTDFDLKAAMRAGLVKSLVLDRRKEIGALPLEFIAERDDNGNPALSEGQRVMLRAGLKKLRKLEADFAALDPQRHPKMLVVCEDTTVSPLVAQFLQDQEGLSADEVMTIDSGKKAELGEKDWAPVRERLFSVDRHATPRVIVSVLMLREGFDVNNICVIVPLRSSQAQILLEQTIGRGLRLMWRDTEYSDLKRENRERINAGQEPGSLLDVLSIVEHPAFQSFYDDLIRDGLAGTTGDDMDDNSATGDVMAAELCDGFEAFDLGIPFILQETDELRDHQPLDVDALPAFTSMTAAELTGLLGKGDTFISQDLQSATLFGDYRVDGAVMNVAGYNDYLSRLTRRISQALHEPLPKGNKIATHLAKPYLQVNTADLTGWLDDYIWTRLFGGTFNPQAGENWRVLLLQPVVDHLTKVFAMALLDSEQQHVTGQMEVHQRQLSEVPRLMVRESHSVAVSKCIYTRLGWPARNGGLERAFIHWAQADAQVHAFCKISENRHGFARLRYVKDDGLPAFYSPDFLVRTEGAVYLVETKAQQQAIHPNVQRKLKAAVGWCDRINTLPPEHRSGLPWHYVLLAENVVHEWQGKGAHLAELLDFARLRPLGEASLQQRLI
ncbi:MAG: DEAD/DEAH box helicase family protein [Hydrogenophaga sp.]|uniref:DEAD/DEAH box helicase family protein n=1 Tax=Hydrogenophaga sp. TaxID=1904254 RepID=UPI0027615FEB|nr:DEAD/DEAH box helicase family protein [Hydrogenophaga sp.]MDP2417943.1 DEAD/DEAH box helicase family protein [Hydrogenophaga sp.]MDZ4187758.1 DEAD/DEAH box helicase family protein [Hydrogenophaga sp.]